MQTKTTQCSLCHSQESHDFLFCNRCWTCIQRARKVHVEFAFMDAAMDYKDAPARERFIASFDDMTATHSL